MKRMKALLIRLLASAIALSMLALTGCDGNSAGNNSGSGAGTAAPTQSGETRDDVVIALASEPSTLCGGLAASVSVNMVSRQMFDTLIQKNGEGGYDPCLPSGPGRTTTGIWSLPCGTT